MSEQTHETAEHKRASGAREQAAARPDQASMLAPSLQLLRDLQQTAGNRAVNRIVHNYKSQAATARASAPMAEPAVQRAPAGGPPNVQRDDPTGGGGGGGGGGTTVNDTPTPDTYDVTASTLSEAADAIRGRKEAGETVWQPSYSTQHDDSGKITSVTIDANITVTMPKWDGAAKLTGTEKTKWTNFMTALQKHENGHVALAQKAFRDVANKMIGKTEAAAKQAFNQAVKDLQKASDTYDKGNDHGKKEGVVIDTDDTDKKSAADLGASDMSADSGTPAPDDAATATV